jgi:hypothetical protein
VTHDKEVKCCMDAIQAVLEICGLDLNCPHEDRVSTLYKTLEELRVSLQTSPEETKRVRKDIAKISMSTCECGHPLWAHNKENGCLSISFSEVELKLGTCKCAQYRFVPAEGVRAPSAFLDVPCPKCRAIKGESCMMKDGEHYPNSSYFHAARKRHADSGPETL